MSKLKPGDRVTIKHEDRSVTGAVRRVGCSDPECPSCEGHWREEPLGYEAQVGHRVLVGPDLDGQGGSFGVVMGDKVRIVSTGQVGKLIRRRLGSHDDRVVVLVDGETVETQALDVLPWEEGN